MKYIKTIKTTCLLILLFTWQVKAYAQNGSLSVPLEIEWQREYWDILMYPNPDNSGEDWFNDADISRDANGNQNGTIAAGYSSYINQSFTWGCHQYSANTTHPELHELETNGNVKGGMIAAVSLMDNQGRVQWYKTFAEGEFFSVKQAANGDYLAIGRTKATSHLFNPIGYNPTGSNNGDDLNALCTPQSGDTRKVYVVRLDRNGNKIWEYIYGMLNFSQISQDGTNAYELSAMGWDLVETPDGNIKLVGCSTDSDSNNKENHFVWGTSTTPNIATRTTPRSFIMEINANGKLRWKNTYQSPNYHSIIRAIDKHTTGGNTRYVVAGIENYVDPYTVSNPTLSDLARNRAFAFMIDDNTNPVPLWVQSYHDNSNSNTVYSKTIVTDVTFNDAGDIILPLVDNARWYGNSGDGMGYIEILDPNTGIPYTSYGGGITQLPISLCRLTAYDLMIGVTSTDDGGFAIVSTKQIDGLPSRPTINDPIFGIPNTCISCPAVERWNTDAYVATFNVDAFKEWEKTFDSHSKRQAGPKSGWSFPDMKMRDVKTQECLYDIFETDDQGLIFVGNTSTNFDDSYLVKLSEETRILSPEVRLGITYNELDLNNASSRFYHSSFNIEATGANVRQNSSLDLEAYQSITLKAGNTIESGSQLYARIKSWALDNVCEPFESFESKSLKGSSGLESFKEESDLIVAKSSLEVFPNPTSYELNLNLELVKSSPVNIELFQQTGERVNILTNNQFTETGIHQFRWIVSDLQAGIYILRIQTSNEVFTEKVVILK